MNFVPLENSPCSRPASTTKWLSSFATAAWLLAGCGGGGGDSPPPAANNADVATAKAFFANLRANASALQSGVTDTGIADGVNTFGSTLQTSAVSAATSVADSIRLDPTAFALWQDYTGGATTDANRNGSAPFTGCTVYQGAFPTSLGPFDTDFVPGSVTATSAANASWIACARNSGPLLATGARRYRQVTVYDMGGAVTAGTYPGAVPYRAVTRSQFTDPATGTTYQRNLTVAYSGSVGIAGTVASPTGFVLTGDLPPLTDSTGTLLADHYAVDLNGSTATLPSGALQATLTSGKFSAVPLAASTSGTLTVDLSDAAVGTSSLTWPNDSAEPAQVAAAQLSLYATIFDATGKMTGSLVVDRFFSAPDGSVHPGRGKFVGAASVVPKGSTTGALVSFLDGTLEFTDSLPTAGVDRAVTFAGRLTLPLRPEASLVVKVSEPTLAAGASITQAISGSYTQDTLTVNFAGTRTPSETSATFSDSNAVATTVSSTTSNSNVTVGGRQTAVIDESTMTIVYSDGTTESLQ